MADITITICEVEKGHGDWPPSDSAGFMDWFAEKLSLIPPEYRAMARVDILSFDGATIEITYTRPETAEDIALRLAEQQQRQERMERSEREQLANLLRKYGTTKT